jgi:hypothetical protein
MSEKSDALPETATLVPLAQGALVADAVHIDAPRVARLLAPPRVVDVVGLLEHGAERPRERLLDHLAVAHGLHDVMRGRNVAHEVEAEELGDAGGFALGRRLDGSAVADVVRVFERVDRGAQAIAAGPHLAVVAACVVDLVLDLPQLFPQGQHDAVGVSLGDHADPPAGRPEVLVLELAQALVAHASVRQLAPQSAHPW